MSDTIQFGKLPSAMIRAGIIARMRTRSEMAVYLALASFVDGSTWRCSPSVAKLVEVSGVRERSVYRAIASLSQSGSIRVIRGGGRHVVNQYQLVTDPANPVTDDTVSTVETLSPVTPFKDVNPVTCDPKPCHPEPETLSPSDINPDTAMAPQQSEQINRSEQMAAAVVELGKNGIGRPTDSKLFHEFPDMTAEHIRLALAEASPGAGPGFRVNLLRERLPELVGRGVARDRLRVWLADHEQEWARLYSLSKDSIDLAIRSLGWTDEQELPVKVSEGMTQKLREDPETKDLPDQCGGVLAFREAIESWKLTAPDSYFFVASTLLDVELRQIASRNGNHGLRLVGTG